MHNFSLGFIAISKTFESKLLPIGLSLTEARIMRKDSTHLPFLHNFAVYTETKLFVPKHMIVVKNRIFLLCYGRLGVKTLYCCSMTLLEPSGLGLESPIDYL